jgi:apolipoprotein N-acyltransferase
VNSSELSLGSRTRAALLVGYAAVTFLSFPHPVGDHVVDLGVVLAWFGPALLLQGLAGLPPRRAATLGFAAGLVAHTAILHWIYIVTVVYGKAPAIAGAAGPLGLGGYIAAFTAAFGAGTALLARGRLDSPWTAALLWTALDHLRSVALSGFPWATLGYAQHQNTALLALVPYTGVYGLSFVSVLGGAALARGVADRAARRRPRADVWLALASVTAVHVAGIAGREAEVENDLARVRVAVLQGNIDQGVKWSEAWAERILANYEDLSREAASQGAEVIVWPESSVPGYVDVDPELRERLANLARDTGATFVLGVVGLEFDSRTRDPIFHDSAVVLDSRGGFGRRYDKAHLVPFGEYVPLRKTLGLFLEAIARGVAPDNVTPGPGPRALGVPASAGQGGVLTMGVPICYELLFPDLVRRMVDDGAEALLAITNDAWYGRTGAPYQFLAMTAMRSAETRVWTARAANTGVSAIIDSRGHVRSRTRIFERGLLVADVPLRPAPRGGSFYVRHGDLFAGACWIGTAVSGVIAWVRSRSKRQTGSSRSARQTDRKAIE